MEEIIRKYFQCWLDKDTDTVKEVLTTILFIVSVMVQCIKVLDR